MVAKPKLALYWASSCGGCDIAVLGLHEKILDVAATFEIVFWPCVIDAKIADVEMLDNNAIDVCLFNGAIRNDDNAHMAHLLRQKSKVLIAFGSCAFGGAIPGLANLGDRDKILDWVYYQSPTTDNRSSVWPRSNTKVPEGSLALPAFWNTVKTLAQVVPVDYFLPGCPPEASSIEAAVQAIVTGTLPPPGSVIGSDLAVCDECPRAKQSKKITRFYRPYEIAPDPDACLLDQGLFCAGIATRGGCGARCPRVGMGCRGCYGPNAGVYDQGAKLITAIASAIDANTPEEVEAVLDTLPDPAGYFYRYHLPGSLLRRRALVDAPGEHGQHGPVNVPSEAVAQGGRA
ncbi:MAG: oxidoreductase [Chloroflexota bacterium]|jgi:F420-non-reducing hydrogenase small subunit|nr:oxidoreductase [Anaerolineae bacterium]